MIIHEYDDDRHRINDRNVKMSIARSLFTLNGIKKKYENGTCL